MSRKDFLNPAPIDYVWPQCPEADKFIFDRIADFLTGHSFARHLSERMREETNTEFQMWVDHLVLPKNRFRKKNLKAIGYIKDKAVVPSGTTLYGHPFADLPRIVLSSKPASSCAIMVDSISDFQLAHGLSLPIEGAPFSRYRESRIKGENGELIVIERRGTRSIVPDKKDSAKKYIEAVELWTIRQRKFPSNAEGMKRTLALAQSLVKSLGTGMAAWAFLEGERRYWQTKNRAAQVQKARQDTLGLGWANHDHHTFRSGRPCFPMLIKILLAFGFKKRERYYAGAEAGWGAQIMEQPESRLIIFADVDLSPQEISVDFTTKALPELDRPGTVGLWCSLHGESILEAGMHHLEAKFDFDLLRNTLKTSGVNFMKPFSDFPHLRQAFSEGELWKVPEDRLEKLLESGRLSPEAYERIKQNGAVGSHLENLQRREGFKGFNQRGVSQIIKEVNPEAQAIRGTSGAAA
jgi:hypothetical protein